MSEASRPAASVRGLAAGFEGVEVFADVDFMVERGSTVAVVGPSGCGKSTLLSALIGIHRPMRGCVLVGGGNVWLGGASGRALLRRRRIGVIFQSPELLPELNVLENVALTAIFDGMSRVDAYARAAEALAAVGVSGLADRPIGRLSGGEAQRVAVARAFTRTDPVLVVADEPTASLDRHHADHVAGVLFDLARRAGVGVVIATHDLAVARRCDLVVDLDGGDAVADRDLR